jgi:hypothetical protein
VNLVYDIYTVTSNLRRYSYLVNQVADIVNRVIRSSIEFVNIVASALAKSNTGFTFVTGLIFGSEVTAINGFGKNTGTRSFSYTTWATKEIGMGQLLKLNRILSMSM